MKKTIKYLALGAVFAISGFMTEANALNFKHKIMNAVDACNEGACGSAKGASLVDKCLPDAETAAKKPKCAAAYWSAYCQGKGAETNADTCGIASSAAELPEGFVCDKAAATTDPLDAEVKKRCFNPLGLKANKDFAWEFWHNNPSADCKNAKSKNKALCASIKKVFAKIATDPDPNPDAPPPEAPAE